MSETHLQNEKQHLKWDTYISECDDIQGLSEGEKSAAKDALSYLRVLLGERFLERNYDLRRNADRHVIGNLILNGVAHTRMNLVRYVEALRSLKDSRNFDKLLNRFKKPDLFYEDESVLQVALEFSHAGFEIEFDPEIPIASPSGVMLQSWSKAKQGKK